MKKNVIFLLKCILMLLPIIAMVAYTALFPMNYMDEEYPSWRYTKDYALGEITGEGLETVVLGDSRAMADIMPLNMPEGCINLAMGGATSIEMYYTLEHMLENNIKPSKAFVMFAPFHYSYADNYKTRTIYFGALDFDEVIEVYRLSQSLGADSIEEVGFFDILSAYLKLPDTYLPALINSRGYLRRDENEASYEKLISEKGHGLFGTADGSSDINYEANYSEMSKDNEYRILDLYMRRLLTLLKDNDIDTIVLCPPMNKSSYDRLNPQFVKEYKEYILQLADEYNTFDFETDIPCYEDKYFGDSSHLNERGAAVYTEYIVSTYINE